MNNADFYDRQHHHAQTTTPRAAATAQLSPPASSELARHGDPSLREPTAPATRSAGGNPHATRWVRSTELPEVGMRALGWVIDRGFAAQSRAIHAVTRSARTRLRRRPEPPAVPGRPAPAPTSGGLGLR